MGLAQIRLMPPPDTAARADYDYQHYQDHLAIVVTILRSSGVELPMFPLWPIVDFAEFLHHHQQMHFDMNRTQGLPNTDLGKLDPADSSARDDWSWRNYQQHLAIHRVLRLN